MHNAVGVTAVCWETRNRRRHDQARTRCRDFGLRQLTGTLWIGTLKPRERADLVAWFQRTFTKTTDKFHCFPLCQHCYARAMLGKLDKGSMSYPPYEIIG